MSLLVSVSCASFVLNPFTVLPCISAGVCNVILEHTRSLTLDSPLTVGTMVMMITTGNTNLKTVFYLFWKRKFGTHMTEARFQIWYTVKVLKTLTIVLPVTCCQTRPCIPSFSACMTIKGLILMQSLQLALPYGQQK